MRITFTVVSLFHIIDIVYSSNIIVIDDPTEAKAGQYPFMASLPFPLGSCGGTLIDPSYILTAAHCLSLYNKGDVTDFRVYLNTLDVMGKDTGSIKASVSSFVIHEKFSNVGTGFVNDIALLVLTEPITSVEPVPLPVIAKSVDKSSKTTTKPTTNTTLKITAKPLMTTITKKKSTIKKPGPISSIVTDLSNNGIITGWGVQSDGFNSDVLMRSPVTIFDKLACYIAWRNLFDRNTMMCAAKGRTSACLYDDGGPILVKGVQVGIASFFPEKCGDPKYPAVFTLISAYSTWIKDTMAANPSPFPEDSPEDL